MSDNKEKNKDKSFNDAVVSFFKYTNSFDDKKSLNIYLKDDVYKKIFTDFANNVNSDDKNNNNKMVASIDDIKKAASLLKFYKKKIDSTKALQLNALVPQNLSIKDNIVKETFINDCNENLTLNEQLDKDYSAKLIKKLRSYKTYYAFEDPNQYTRRGKIKEFGPYKDLRSRFMILNDLNFDDEEIEKELYKYDKARNKYKKFKYPKNDRILCFSALSKNKKNIYVNESLNTFPDTSMDMKFKYFKYPNMFLKRYFNKKYTYKEIRKNNLRQVLFSIYLINTTSRNKNFIVDANDYMLKAKQSKHFRKEDRRQYFFKIKNKLMNRKKVLAFERAKRALLKKRVKRLSFKYENVIQLNNYEIQEMIKLLCSYDSKTKTFPFLNEPHKIFKYAKTDFDIGKACLAYLRKKVNKKKTKQFLKKMKWKKKEIKLLSVAKKRNFSLMNFFTSDYTLRSKKSFKKDIDIDYYLSKTSKKTLLALYKSFDKIFLPMFIASKFNIKIYKNKK